MIQDNAHMNGIVILASVWSIFGMYLIYDRHIKSSVTLSKSKRDLYKRISQGAFSRGIPYYCSTHVKQMVMFKEFAIVDDLKCKICNHTRHT